MGKPGRAFLAGLAALALTAGAAPGGNLAPHGVPRSDAMLHPPRAGDVASPEALLAAVYAAISGPAGTRDWDRFRALFLPEARLTDATADTAGHPQLRQWGVAQFISQATASIAKQGFFETGLVNRFARFGGMAQVFSSYESRRAPDARPFARGINSMQFAFDGRRWWVVSILWDAERPGNALPADMAGPAGK